MRAIRRTAWSRGSGLALACGLLAGAPAADETPETLRYRVVAAHPHDRQAFTQGLVYEQGALYESTGHRGQSTLRQVELATGRSLMRVPLPRRYFAEGLTSFGGRLFQLTWTAGEAFVYRQRDLTRIGGFRYDGEGWGLAQDGTHLIMSDGSATLSFRDPGTFEEAKRIVVRDRGRPVPLLNELEYVRGSIFANVWPTSRIARIAAETGVVTGWLDLSDLARDMQRHPGADVLNGIAYVSATGRFLVTGKNWPKLFVIELVPEGPADRPRHRSSRPGEDGSPSSTSSSAHLCWPSQGAARSGPKEYVPPGVVGKEISLAR